MMSPLKRKQPPARASRWLSFWLVTVSATAAALGSLGGCKRGDDPPKTAPATPPALRIYALGGAAGAIEPCGCVANMLGGVDHLAAFIAGQKSQAPASLLVAAGPLFFEGRRVAPNDLAQAWMKAQTMAESLREAGLVAWAPGANDLALGAEKFLLLKEATGARALAANWKSSAPLTVASEVVNQGGLQVGLVGVSLPTWLAPPDVPLDVSDASAALQAERDRLRQRGAQIVVALIAGPRGDALRLAERVGGFQLVVVGKGFDEGENNDAPFPPELVAGSLVVQAPNHIQGVGVVDLFVREGGYQFADGSGVTASGERESLEQRRAELSRRIAGWERGGNASASELAARKRDLAALEDQLAAAQKSNIPASGSYFLYDFTEVREAMGTSGPVAARLRAYYQRVNEHNRELFKDKLPVAAAPGQPSYVGVESCSSCHQEERKFWNTTAHAGAYETLSRDHKEFNLDCVSCHVTGYEKPGGSTVTHVEGLRDVQCENCHGPGSQHVKKPLDKQAIRRTPAVELCAESCHHTPHVGNDWNVGQAWGKIIGPGHGR